MNPSDLPAGRKGVCVFCASSDAVEACYFDAAAELGAEIARRNYSLVYGGTSVGLMRAVALAAHANGGSVIGVIPEAIRGMGIAYEAADELIITRTMAERKAMMHERSHAFVVLPGGFGTLEEFFEILTLRQLNYHDKPIVLLNVNAFFDPLLDLFEHLYAGRFARAGHHSLYHVAATPAAALDYLESYRPVAHADKWFEPKR
jgi:cytokinin riboside 5'-monophosphate phosphoribohydrolase